MTIVTEERINAAAEYILADPHPLPDAKKALLFAEKQTAETFAQLYLAATGTQKERESAVIIDPLYKAARLNEIEAEAAVERERRRWAAAESMRDLWRTEQSNERAAEKIR